MQESERGTLPARIYRDDSPTVVGFAARLLHDHTGARGQNGHLVRNAGIPAKISVGLGDCS
jgi:hypothetical protein